MIYDNAPPLPCLLPQGDVKLLDLGLSRVVSKSEMDNARYNMTGETGSARYMAPEVRGRVLCFVACGRGGGRGGGEGAYSFVACLSLYLTIDHASIRDGAPFPLLTETPLATSVRGLRFFSPGCFIFYFFCLACSYFSGLACVVVLSCTRSADISPAWHSNLRFFNFFNFWSSSVSQFLTTESFSL